jgi:hypothetical protein
MDICNTYLALVTSGNPGGCVFYLNDLELGLDVSYVTGTPECHNDLFARVINRNEALGACGRIFDLSDDSDIFRGISAFWMIDRSGYLGIPREPIDIPTRD